MLWCHLSATERAATTDRFPFWLVLCFVFFFYFRGAFCPQHRAWVWQCWKKESSSSSSSVSNISRRSKLESQCASSSPSSPWTKSCVGAHHVRPAHRSSCLTDVWLGRGGCQTQILTVSYGYSQSNFQNLSGIEGQWEQDCGSASQAWSHHMTWDTGGMQPLWRRWRLQTSGKGRYATTGYRARLVTTR